MIITKHAYKRAKERLSLSKSAVDRMAAKAFEKGIIMTDSLSPIKAEDARYYAGYIFVFEEDRLITIFPSNKKYKQYTEQ